MVTKRRYTNDERWEIMRVHMDTHGNGELNTVEFLDAASDPAHPAHDYFEWDDSKAAHSHRIQQVRQFFHVVIDKEDVKLASSDEVTFTVMPAVVSPLASRNSDNPVYIPADTPEGHAAICEEFAKMNEDWLNRRRGILTKRQITAVEKAIASLRVKAVRKAV